MLVPHGHNVLGAGRECHTGHPILVLLELSHLGSFSHIPHPNSWHVPALEGTTTENSKCNFWGGFWQVQEHMWGGRLRKRCPYAGIAGEWDVRLDLSSFKPILRLPTKWEYIWTGVWSVLEVRLCLLLQSFSYSPQKMDKDCNTTFHAHPWCLQWEFTASLWRELCDTASLDSVNCLMQCGHQRPQIRSCHTKTWRECSY